MGPLLVVFRDPSVEIGLQFLQHPIDLLPERHAKNSFNMVLWNRSQILFGLGMPRFRPGAIDVLHGQVQFILMPLRRSEVLRAAIGEDPVEGNLVLLQERNTRSGDRRA